MKRAVLCTLASLVWCPATCGAGPLDPPSGPVASTMKTLDEVEPRIVINETNTPGDDDSLFRITAPGSYYLESGALVLPLVSGKVIGIEVAADDVTIDLNGFTITGGMNATAGISVDGPSWTGLRVHDGTITGFADGILMEITNEYTTLTGLRVYGNTQRGIRVGRFAAIERCLVSDNGTIGIQSDGGTRIDACVVTNNGGVGVDLGPFSVVDGCTVSGNGGHGIDTMGGSMILGNRVISNGASVADGTGIALGGPTNRVQGNHVNGHDLSVTSVSDNLIVLNTLEFPYQVTGDVDGFVATSPGLGSVRAYWVNFIFGN